MTRTLLAFLGALLLMAAGAQAARLDELVGRKDSGPGFLEVDQAFRFSADVIDGKLYARWQIAPGYYLYQHSFQFTAEGATLGQPAYPAGEQHQDEYFGQVAVHRGLLEVPLSVTGDGEFSLRVRYQGCADKGLCYPPTEKTVALRADLDTPAAAAPAAASQATTVPLTEETRLSRLLGTSSLPAVTGLFLLAGLALAFTPCVFPMLPIVASLVAGSAARPSSAWRGFALSFAYVQGMALSFAALGVAAALAGRGLAGAFQSPWMVGAVSGLFVLLALAMFGVYELRLPLALVSRAGELSNRQRAGTYAGAAFMGVLSTLVISPCVTAPLTAAMLYIAQSGDKLLGALALYALALGMGLPLLVLGTAGGRLLPRAGAWMAGVRGAFGVLMLGLALYLGGRFLPGPVQLLGWASLCMVSAVYLGAFARDRESKWTPLRQGLGLLLFTLGIAQALGAAMGHGNPLAPLAGLALSAPARAEAQDGLAFRRFKTVEELDRLLAEARAANKPVMVDFVAGWCVACRDFAEQTFPDPAVRPFLKRAVLLQADVTANDPEDRRLLEAKAVLGLPTLLFYGPDGRELAEARVTGFLPAAEFARHLRGVWGN